MSCDPAATWLRFARDAPADVNLTRISLVDREGQNLASMARSCTLLFAAGAAVCSDGVLVELGTWAGGSMRCYGAGLNRTGYTHRAHGFDAFRAGFCVRPGVCFSSNTRKLNNTRWWSAALATPGGADHFDLLPVFNWQTQDVYPSVRAHVGDFHLPGAVARTRTAQTVILLPEPVVLGA